MSFVKKISTRALYIQVRDHLAQQIARGVLKPGTPLPSELELADQLGVSLGTLRKGLEALESERLITRRQGSGTYVRDHAADMRFTFDNLRTKGGEAYRIAVLAQEHEVLVGSASESVEISLASEEVAVRLEVEFGTPLLRLDRIIYSLGRVPLEWRIGYCRMTTVKYVTTLRS